MSFLIELLLNEHTNLLISALIALGLFTWLS
jgi:hypothetical protein